MDNIIITKEEKAKTRLATHRAVKDGLIIKPANCSNCGKPEKLEPHHHDYAKPLSVVWLCEPCHILLHNVLQRNRPRSPGRPALGPRIKTKLTKREIEVMKMVCAGMRNKEIAAKLQRGIRTIETHRERINRFTGAHNALQIVAWALANNYVSNDIFLSAKNPTK